MACESSADELLVEHLDADQHRRPGPRPPALTPSSALPPLVFPGLQQAQRIDELTAAALQATAILTTTSYGEQEHTSAAKAFRTAFTTRQSETKQHRQQTRAEQARTRLAQDDQLHNAHTSTIQAGKAAAQTMRLRLRLRTTIAEALGEAALLPVWFTTVLGVTPPRSGANEWLDIATEVVAYRITYRVTDPVLALGVKPDTDTQDQYRSHQELADKLRRYSS